MHYDLRRLRKLLLAPYAGPLLESFEQRRQVLDSRLRKARKRPSEKAIHDLRVALRRMLSLLALTDAVLLSDNARPGRRELRKQLRRLSGIRDIQNQIVLADELLAEFPQLTAFRKHLTARGQRLARRAAADLSRFRPGRIRKLTRKLLNRLIRSLDPESDSVVGEKLRASVEDAYRRVLLRRVHIDPRDPATIHRTRVAFKRFRYMAEIAAPSIPHLTAERLAVMRAYQGRMGAIQDLDTLLQTLMEFRRSSGQTSILVVENEIRRRRQRLIDEFMATADELRFFWTTPEVASREVV